MLIKSLKSGNHYQFITLFVVCATGRSCLLFSNIVPFDNKDSAKKKHRQIYLFIKVLCDRAEVPAGQGEYILQSNVFLQFLSSILFRKATEHGRGEVDAWFPLLLVSFDIFLN